MFKPARVVVAVLAVLLLPPLAACGGDDDEREAEQKPVDGSFVGQLSGTDALVAVVAAPPEKGKDKRTATIYVSDGSKLSESFAGSITRNSLTATGGEAEAKGELAGDSAKGSVKLPDGKSANYEARRATGAAGLYRLTVSKKGRLSGASAAGVGLTSKSRLRVPGKGTLKFADGKRRKFEVMNASGGDRGPVRAGEVQLIVLPDGKMSGAGARKAGASEPDFFLKSAR